MSEDQDKFELYTQLVAKICEIKLAYLISKDVQFEYLGIEESKIVNQTIELDKDSMVLAIPLEALDSSLIIHTDSEEIPAIADIFAGGDGEVEPEITDTQKLIYHDTNTQLISSIFKYLVFKSKNFLLQYEEPKESYIEAFKPTNINVHGSFDPVAFKFKLTLNGEKSIEYVFNADRQQYDDFLKKLEDSFPDLNIALMEEELKKELSASGSTSGSSLESALQKESNDASYAVNEIRNLDFIRDVNLDLIVELGRAEMPFGSVLDLTKGSAIELERACNESVDLYVHNQLVAKGEVIAIDDCFGLKITEVVGSLNIFKDIKTSSV